VGLESREKSVNPQQETVIDYAFVFEGDDLVPPLCSLLVYLRLLGADERFLIDVGMDLDVGVIAKLQGILLFYECVHKPLPWACTYPLAVVDRHF